MNYIEEAIIEAKKGTKEKEGGPFGCVIIKDGKIISKAHNTVLKTNDCTNHAEMNAIRKACKKLETFNLKKCQLYTTTYPCPMCLGAILWSGIEAMYYLTTSNDVKKIGFDDAKYYDFYKGKNKRMLETTKTQQPKIKKEFTTFLSKYKGKKY